MKQTKEQVIENLKNIPYNVYFSLDDVVNILEEIEDTPKVVEKKVFDIDTIQSKIQDEIVERITNLIDNMDLNILIRDYSLSMSSGNEVHLDSIEIIKNNLENEIDFCLNEYFDELRDEQEEQEEEVVNE